MIPAIGCIDGKHRSDPENPEKRIGEVEDEAFEKVGERAFLLYLDFVDGLNLLGHWHLLEKGINSVNGHHDATDDAEYQVIFGIGNDGRSAEIESDHQGQVADKDSGSKEYPDLYPVLDAGLKQCKQGRTNGNGNRQSEDDTFK